MKGRNGMDKIRAVLVDDEPEATRGMQETLSLFCPEVEVVATAGSVQEGISMITEKQPQLIFLDIQMRDGLGFDLLERLPDRKFATIFITAFDQFTLRALRMNAMDYLLKPVDPDELVAAVDRARQEIQYPDYAELIGSHARGVFTKIGVPSSKGTVYIELTEIIRMESSSNYTYIHCLEGRPVLIARTIKSFEEILPAEGFVRCHQRHIVSLEHVREYVRSENSFLVLSDGTEVPVSRANKTRIDLLLKTRFPGP